MLGAPGLARRSRSSRSGLPSACGRLGACVLAYAVDVIVGSPLTSLSLLGPNPGLGVRFYGIGNELEALLGGARRRRHRGGARRIRAAALAAPLRRGLPGDRLLFALVFAAGRFGADVGAAIVLPIGAAVAAATIAARRGARRSRHCRPAGVSGADRPGRPGFRSQRASDPIGPRCRWARRPRRCRAAAPAAFRPQLQPSDRLPLPAADRRPRRPRRRPARPPACLAASLPAVGGAARGARRDRRRHARQRLRRAAAGDRRRLPARLRRLCLEPSGLAEPRRFPSGRSTTLSGSCGSRSSRHIPGPTRAA